MREQQKGRRIMEEERGGSEKAEVKLTDNFV